MRYVCLLRGVNVGGHSKLSMAEFRELLGGVGATGVRTYIQSGNAVFEHDLRDAVEIAALVADALRDQLGSSSGVLVLAAAELGTIAAAQPFPHEDSANAKVLYVGFLLATPCGEVLALPPPPNTGADEFALGERAVYLRCPDGFGRTKLNGTFFERALGVPVTFRNWRTVLTLLKMVGD